MDDRLMASAQATVSPLEGTEELAHDCCKSLDHPGHRPAGSLATGLLATGLLLAAALIEAVAAVGGRVVVTAPSAPGSSLDQLARKLAGTLATSGLVSSIDVTDVPGNNGLVGLRKFMDEAAGDGSRALVVSLPLVAAAVTTRSPVLPSKGTPLARLTSEPQAVVVPATSAINEARDLGRVLKEDPIAVRFAGGTAGGIDHATAGLLAIAAGADPAQVNYVPFLNSTEALSALLKDQIDVAIGPYAEFEGQIASGKLRLLGVTAEERLAAIPGPTFREQGLDVTLANWKAVVGGPALREPEARRLAGAIASLATSEAWSQVLQGRRWHDAYLDAEGFATFLAAEEKRMADVMKALGLVP